MKVYDPPPRLTSCPKLALRYYFFVNFFSLLLLFVYFCLFALRHFFLWSFVTFMFWFQIKRSQRLAAQGGQNPHDKGNGHVKRHQHGQNHHVQQQMRSCPPQHPHPKGVSRIPLPALNAKYCRVDVQSMTQQSVVLGKIFSALQQIESGRVSSRCADKNISSNSNVPHPSAAHLDAYSRLEAILQTAARARIAVNARESAAQSEISKLQA
eukprot:SAG31_NODE_6624_length_1946_cov_1.814293_2_plen_209_part_01